MCANESSFENAIKDMGVCMSMAGQADVSLFLPRSSRSFSHAPRHFHVVLSSSCFSMISGSLFVYHPEKDLVAFTTHPSSSVALILVAGLSGGLLSLPYTEPLADKLSHSNISLIMPLLSSSYHGYGTSTLAMDAQELTMLLRHCCSKLNLQQLILMGHSTGCQDVMTLMMQGFADDPCLLHRIKGIILQGPASDRQYMESLSMMHPSNPLPGWIEHCRRALSQGNSDELLPMSPTRVLGHHVPMTVERFYSLASPDGADDLFSIDEATCSKLQTICESIACPMLVLLSECDEYVPSEIPIAQVYAWFQKALSTRKSQSKDKIFVLKGAQHNLENKPSFQQASDLLPLLHEWIHCLF